MMLLLLLLQIQVLIITVVLFFLLRDMKKIHKLFDMLFEIIKDHQKALRLMSTNLESTDKFLDKQQEINKIIHTILVGEEEGYDNGTN